jgi:predicted nucleic-acid-binding protein
MLEKKRLKSWDQDTMIQAVSVVRKKKVEFKKAQKMLKGRKISLKRCVNMNDKPREETLLTKLRSRSVFSKDVEQELVEYLVVMDQQYFGLTRQDIRMMAFQLAKKNNFKNSFSELRGCARKGCLNRVLKRHKTTISIRSATGTSVARAKVFNRAAVIGFFDITEAEFEKHN